MKKVLLVIGTMLFACSLSAADAAPAKEATVKAPATQAAPAKAEDNTTKEK